MLKVENMSSIESQALLLRVGYGHLGCARDNHPYVVPMHYAYDGADLYFFTTHGTKTEYIEANPDVCLQVEEVANDPSLIVLDQGEINMALSFGIVGDDIPLGVEHLV